MVHFKRGPAVLLFVVLVDVVVSGVDDDAFCLYGKMKDSINNKKYSQQ